MDEESARQEKVVSQRPDAQAGVDLTGHKIGVAILGRTNNTSYFVDRIELLFTVILANTAGDHRWLA